MSNSTSRMTPYDFSCPQDYFKNIPHVLTPLVAREQEVATLCQLFRHEQTRLITLLGPGGVGKTRLSLHIASVVADLFVDGMCFVPLSYVRGSGSLAHILCDVLEIQEAIEVPRIEQLRMYLQKKRFLLILDNFEHIRNAIPVITRLLNSCPHLSLLITSRRPLHIPGEYRFSVLPLSLPDRQQLPPLPVCSTYGAVQLFVQRLQMVIPTFQLTEETLPAVVDICAYLDGVPLALELAAQRCKIMSLQALSASMTGRLSLLTDSTKTLPVRHQSLARCVEWSYTLLSVQEQCLLQYLSVFSGGWTLQAVEAVWKHCPLDTAFDLHEGIARLIDHCLLWHDSASSRLMMLEMVRQYALELFLKDERSNDVQLAHALYYLHLLEEEVSILHERGQTSFVALQKQEQKNIQRALQWCTSRQKHDLIERFEASLQQLHEANATQTDESELAGSRHMLLVQETSSPVASVQAENAVYDLTVREREVLQLLAQGWTDSQIATHLVISIRTVHAHTASIYRKLQVSSRSAATRLAIARGLVQ